MADSWRLAVGTFTRIPVPAPVTVDKRTAGRALILAPVIAAALGASVTAAAVGVGHLIGPDGLQRLLLAVLVVAATTWITRALHLDGLADTADALGSGKPASAALEIARRSDIGPFGVLSLIIALAAQTVAIAIALTAGGWQPIATVAVLFATSRVALLWSTTRYFPAARPDGLGAMVACSVPVFAAVLWTAAVVGAAIAVNPMLAFAVAAGLAAGIGVSVLVRRRFGGITGDTLGGSIEVSLTTALIVAAVLV
jgi:adenosylcobinamide-GDP ribazoletransferase